MLRCLKYSFVVAAIVAGTGTASAQNYPNKFIRVVTTGTGGTADLTARLIAQGLLTRFGQQVIVDNRPGVVAAEIVSKAQPDGYTLLVYASSFWIAPLLQDVSFDPIREFSPITLAITSPNVLVVHPSVPAKSVGELITLLKSKPGALNYGTSGTGNSNHLAGELFKAMTGTDMVRINYKAIGGAINDLIAGQVQVMFVNAGAVAQHVKGDRLRALAVCSAKSSALTPGMPTVAASGLPGYQSVSAFGVFAPARTPPALITILNQEIGAYLNKPEVKEKLFNTGVEVVGSSPAELAATMKSDIAQLGKVIKDAGIRGD